MKITWNKNYDLTKTLNYISVIKQYLPRTNVLHTCTGDEFICTQILKDCQEDHRMYEN